MNNYHYTHVCYGREVDRKCEVIYTQDILNHAAIHIPFQLVI